jgi:hypothetical protein
MKSKAYLPRGRALRAIPRSLAVIVMIMTPLAGWAVGSWVPVANFPYSNPSHMLLLSDGSVMVQQYQGAAWYHLTPDSQGHYVNGHWSTFNNMESPRLFYSSDVLKDGRVFVAGGEDPQTGNQGTTNAEVFNPQANGGAGSWTYVNPPISLFNPIQDQFSDSDSIILADGTVLITPVTEYEATTLIYDPVANSWSRTGDRLQWQDEATWLKLPDNSVLTIDINEGNYFNTYNTAERYIPSLRLWQPESNTPTNADGLGSETGGAFMLADGRAFFLLGSGHTVFYTPSGNTNRGAWQQGPDMPLLNTNQFSAVPVPLATNNGVVIYNNYLQLSPEDAPAAMLPSGKILCQIARDGVHMPVWFYEFDPSTATFVPAPSPNNPAPGSYYNVSNDNSDSTSMLLLPDGSVLYSDRFSLYIYQPDGSPSVSSGKPAIASITPNASGTYHLTGTRLNGFSQGASYGDDFQMDSNYPLVRMTNSASGNVYYARTYNWSSTGVQTGNTPVTTEFELPVGVLTNSGSYSLVVVANGIPSDPVSFNVPASTWVDFTYSGSPQNGSYSNPFSTLAQGTNAVPSGGTIAIKGPAINATGGAASSPGATKLVKPMKLVAIGGQATIGP